MMPYWANGGLIRFPIVCLNLQKWTGVLNSKMTFLKRVSIEVIAILELINASHEN